MWKMISLGCRFDIKGTSIVRCWQQILMHDDRISLYNSCQYCLNKRRVIGKSGSRGVLIRQHFLNFFFSRPIFLTCNPLDFSKAPHLVLKPNVIFIIDDICIWIDHIDGGQTSPRPTHILPSPSSAFFSVKCVNWIFILKAE